MGLKDDFQGTKTLQEVADMHGLSREMIRQIYANQYRTPYSKPPPEGMYT